ncbi:MAG: hypothetical protein HUN04_00595 [Desulfobacter sp.]|nr:MAG: hypothetical protein HUN04_00595 [Desulfobacter sp.]
MQKIREKHKPIAKYFDDASIGNILMNYDSQIMEKVLLHFADKGVAAIPIHDSVIVPIEYCDECGEVMKSEFQNVFHQNIEVSGSYTEAMRYNLNRINHIDRSSRCIGLELDAIADGILNNWG